MIFQYIIIENFLCYYKSQRFDFSPGLNIILGDNGEGKTKFFEALDWLLNERAGDTRVLVSEKAISELKDGASFKVSVELCAEHNGDVHLLRRFFEVWKTSDGKIETGNFEFRGQSENQRGERTEVQARSLLEYIFPNQIRAYSLFKGESELDIFKKNDDALMNLIHKFSKVRYFEKYVSAAEAIKERADKNVEDSSKRDLRNQSKYNSLELEITKLQSAKEKCLVEIQVASDQLETLTGKLSEAERYLGNAQELQTVKSEIERLQKQIKDAQNRIDDNFTTPLFDDQWILEYFEPYLDAYVKEVEQANLRRREIQSDFDREQGIKEGERRAHLELINKAVPLPVTVPSKAHMEEMLNEEICKVCNTAAPKGSPPYNFMLARLEEYYKTQQPVNDDEQADAPLKFDYLSRMLSLGTKHENDKSLMRSIPNAIASRFQFNEDRRREVMKWGQQFESASNDRDRIVGKAIGEMDLLGVISNNKQWTSEHAKFEKTLGDLQAKLSVLELEIAQKVKEKEEIDQNSASGFFLRTRELVRQIQKIFRDTRESMYDQFVSELGTQSNAYFSRMNKGSFTGEIVFRRYEKGNRSLVAIELQESGKKLHRPNQSLETSMHISILFGISQIAKVEKDDSYPMVFDAPTSSFGETKTAEFLDIISEADGQIILLTKEFIVRNAETGDLEVKASFRNVKRSKAMWIRVQRPFDPNNLSSVATEVISI